MKLFRSTRTVLDSVVFEKATKNIFSDKRQSNIEEIILFIFKWLIIVIH